MRLASENLARLRPGNYSCEIGILPVLAIGLLLRGALEAPTLLVLLLLSANLLSTAFFHQCSFATSQDNSISSRLCVSELSPRCEETGETRQAGSAILRPAASAQNQAPTRA